MPHLSVEDPSYAPSSVRGLYNPHLTLPTLRVLYQYKRRVILSSPPLGSSFNKQLAKVAPTSL